MLFGRRDIQKGVEECRATPGGLLVDVREAAEYRAGHIPGAVNAPLSEISRMQAERDRPLLTKGSPGRDRNQLSAEK